MVKSRGVGEAEGLPPLPKECPAGRCVRVPWALLRAEPPAVLGTLLVTLPVCPEPPACYRGILLGSAVQWCPSLGWRYRAEEKALQLLTPTRRAEMGVAGLS